MESGELDLKAWGSGVAPQAQLHFNDELILKNQYLPVVGWFREGSKLPAYRCKDCRFVCFRYGDNKS
jgi:hypothetical protein